MLHRIFSDLYSDQHDLKLSPTSQKCFIIFANLIHLGQIVNYLWNPKLNLKNWSNFSGVFAILSYSSIDNIASALSELQSCLLFFCSLILFNFVLIILHSIFTLSGFKIPVCLLKLMKLSLSLTSDHFFIPCIYLLVMLYKYSATKHNEIEEYLEKNSGTLFDFGILGQIGSIVLLAIHIPISFLHTCLNCNIRHAAKDIVLTAKVDVKFELVIKFAFALLSIAFPLLQINHYIVFLCLTTMFLFMTTLYHVSRMPYFSVFTNFIIIVKYVEGVSLGIFFLTGYALNSLTIVLVLCFFMQPVIVLISYEFVKFRSRYIYRSNDIISFNNFELQNRSTFSGKSGDNLLMGKTNFIYLKEKNQMIKVIQSYYYLDVIRNTSLASIKISQATCSNFNFFAKFQIEKCKEAIRTEGLESSYGIKIIKFINDQQLAFNKDKQFCKLFLKLLEKLQENSSTQKVLENLILKSDEKITIAKKKYKDLARAYPDSNIISKMYGSFLMEIVGNSSMAQIFLSKSEMVGRNRNSKEKYLEVFYDESICVAITSGSQNSLGKILNTNISLCNFLEIEQEDILNMTLMDLLPIHKDFNLANYLIKFVETCASQYLHVNQLMYLKNKKGYLKECIVTTECIGLDSKIQFVSVIEPHISPERQSALLYQDGTIFAQSEELADVFDMHLGKIEMMNIKDLVPQFDAFSKSNSNCFYVKNIEKNQLFSFTEIYFESCTCILMVVYLDDEEIRTMEINHGNPNNFYDTSIRRNKEKRSKTVFENIYPTFHENVESMINKDDAKKGTEEVRIDEKETNAVSNSSKINFRDTTESKYIQKTFKFFSFLKVVIGILVSYT